MNKQKGFTLVEILVSLLVLSVLGVILAGGVQQISAWQQRLLADMREASAYLRFQSLLMNDLLQVAPRSITDAYGGRLPPCQSLSLNGFECSRFDILVGSAGVVRIGYAVQDEALWRWHWSVLDRVPESQPVRQKILDHIDEMIVRWQDKQGNWLMQWPPAGISDSIQLPLQIEIALQYKNKEIVKMSLPVSEAAQ